MSSDCEGESEVSWDDDESTRMYSVSEVWGEEEDDGDVVVMVLMMTSLSSSPHTSITEYILSSSSHDISLSSSLSLPKGTSDISQPLLIP